MESPIMDNNLLSQQDEWLSPSVALSRFKPSSDLVEGIAPEFQRNRYGFRIGGFGLVIDVNTTSEVIDQLPIYSIPNAPSWLLGLINLRGNLVPVFDLRILLNVEKENDQKRRLLILGQGEKAVAIPINNLPEPPNLSRTLPRLPPLPAILRDHISAAYVEQNFIWLEFQYHSFFQSLAAQMKV
jgi:twitching motility protein PilI